MFRLFVLTNNFCWFWFFH